LLQAFNTLICFGLTDHFAMIYKLMPRAKCAGADAILMTPSGGAPIHHRQVFDQPCIGHGVASGLWHVGSVVVVLVWVYYSI
jgi:hypothetical protein